MKWTWTIVAMAALAAAPGWALEEIHTLATLDKLAQRATESVDVTLDAPMLRLASAFLSSDDPDEARVKKMVAKLKGVYVRSFEFDHEGAYSAADVEGVRSGLTGPGWARIVRVKSLHSENAEVYMKKDGDQVGGVVVIDAEPKELTVVDIDGPIDPEELSELGGHLGIPKLGKKTKGEKGSGKGDQ